jgi:hypothetical protein
MNTRKSSPAAAAVCAYSETLLFPELYVVLAPIRPRKSFRWGGGPAEPSFAAS